MAKSQLRGSQVKDGSIQRVDIDTATLGQAVITKIVEEANSGIKIKSQTGVDAGTGDVTLEVNRPYLDTQYPSMTGTGANIRAQNTFFAGPSTGGSGLPTFRTITAADIPTLAYVPYTGATQNVNLGDKNLEFTTGSLSKTEGTTRTFNKVYQNHTNSGSTGIISLIFPQASTAAVVFDIVVKIYSYTNALVGEIRLSFYKNSATTIISSGSKATLLGSVNFPTSTLRVGVDNAGSVRILIGDVGFNWGTNLHVEVERVSALYTGHNADWSAGWSQVMDNTTPNLVASGGIFQSLLVIPLEVNTAHANKPFLDVINQNLGTTHTPTFNSLITSRLGRVGTYNAAQTQGIWGMGSSYNVNATTTGLGTLYGLGYSYISVGGSSLASKHQVHFAENGTAKVTVNLTDGEVRANRFTSLIAAGTAPFTVTSDTVVTNLNADKLDGRHGNQFINLEANTDTTGNNVDWNTLSYSTLNPAWYLQPIHTPNYTGQTNAPFQGTSEYGTVLTLPASLPSQFGHQIAFGHLGTIKYRSIYNDDNFTSSWVDIWTTATFNPANYVLTSSLTTTLGNYVTANGVQTIYQTKTFDASPIVPTPTLAGHAVNKGYVDGNFINQNTLTVDISEESGELRINPIEIILNPMSSIDDFDGDTYKHRLVYILVTKPGTIYLTNLQAKQRLVILNVSDDTVYVQENGQPMGTLYSSEKVSAYKTEDSSYDYAIYYDKGTCAIGSF